MSLSAKVVKELRTELVELRASHARVEARIAAIKLLLGNETPMKRSSRERANLSTKGPATHSSGAASTRAAR